MTTDIDQVENSTRSALDWLFNRIRNFNDGLAKLPPAQTQRWCELQLALAGDGEALHLTLTRLRTAAAGLESVSEKSSR